MIKKPKKIIDLIDFNFVKFRQFGRVSTPAITNVQKIPNQENFMTEEFWENKPKMAQNDEIWPKFDEISLFLDRISPLIWRKIAKNEHI